MKLTNAQIEALARRTIWLAFTWNDHNFEPAHVMARETCHALGIEDQNMAEQIYEDLTYTPAAQAGEWTTVVPAAPGLYWARNPEGGAAYPAQQTEHRAWTFIGDLDVWSSNELKNYEFWSVPLTPPAVPALQERLVSRFQRARDTAENCTPEALAAIAMEELKR